MSQYCGRTLKLVTQQRRGRSMRATVVAPNSRPEALRDLYLDAGTRIRRAAVTGSPTRASK